MTAIKSTDFTSAGYPDGGYHLSGCNGDHGGVHNVQAPVPVHTPLDDVLADTVPVHTSPGDVLAGTVPVYIPPGDVLIGIVLNHPVVHGCSADENLYCFLWRVQ